MFADRGDRLTKTASSRAGWSSASRSLRGHTRLRRGRTTGFARLALRSSCGLAGVFPLPSGRRRSLTGLGSGRLPYRGRLVLHGGEPDLDRAAEGRGDAAEHGEAVAAVIGVLQAADDRGGGADPLCEVLLGQLGLGAEPVN